MRNWVGMAGRGSGWVVVGMFQGSVSAGRRSSVVSLHTSGNSARSVARVSKFSLYTRAERGVEEKGPIRMRAWGGVSDWERIPRRMVNVEGKSR